MVYSWSHAVSCECVGAKKKINRNKLNAKKKQLVCGTILHIWHFLVFNVKNVHSNVRISPFLTLGLTYV